MRPQVGFQLTVHDGSRNQQGQFAQSGELMFFGKRGGAIPGAGSPRLSVAGASTTTISSALLSRKPAGMVQEARLPVMRSTSSCSFSRYCTFTVVTTEMPASSNCSTSCQRCAIGTAGRILVRKPVDQCDLGMSPNYRGHVDRFSVARFQHRNDFEFLQYGLNFRRVFRLQGANHDVLAALAAPAAFVQHLE